MVSPFAGLASSTALTRSGDPLIRICLDSLHANYSTVTAALTIRLTQDADHNSDLKVITAVDPIIRTGDLASIHRDNLGDGVFKDEYVGWQDFQRRGAPLLGQGAYDGQVRYIRPEVTFASGTGAPTTVSSYGDADGMTYGDAYAGPKGYQDAKSGLTGQIMLFIVGEHILTQDIISGSRTISTMGDVIVDQSGTNDATRTQVRFDYPNIEINGYVFDRGVIYGGMMLIDTGQSWSSDIVAMPYDTVTVALVDGDRGKVITMDTDGDTGTILDFDGSTIWIGTDGTAGNSFDNSPTADDTFTITSGTGAASQNGAASATSNIWWWGSRPSRNAGEKAYGRDPGSHFGNPVDLAGYRKKTGLVGTAFEHDLFVNTAPGMVPLGIEDTISACISTEDSVYEVGGTGSPLVVHIVSGEDPTNRIISPSFGIDLQLGGESQSHITVKGMRQRLGGLACAATDNWTVDDFSIRYAEKAIDFDPDDWTVDHSNYRFTNGCILDVGSGIYPAKAADEVRTIEDILAEGIYFERIGGGFFPQGDNHIIGSQGALKNWTIRKNIGGPDTGNITLYDWGRWSNGAGAREWGTVLIEQNDFQDGPMDDWPSKGSNAADSAIHLSGDNNDEAYLGNAKASPDTTKADTADVTIQNNKVRGDWLQPIRSKWRDNQVLLTDNDTDTTATNGVDISLEGTDTNWNDVVRVPVSTTTALVAADAGRVITMDTDGDTGTIVDFDGDDILVRTDGTAGNSFDNSPTANDTFTITGGTGAGSQTGVGVAEPNRAPRVRIRNHIFGDNSDAFIEVNVADATDYVVDSDDNTYPGAESDLKFIVSGSGTISGTSWKAKSRSGNGFNAEASVFDPNSTWTG